MTNHLTSGERWHNSETKGGTLLGVWFMPDNVMGKVLEDFVLALPHQNALMKQRYIEKCKNGFIYLYLMPINLKLSYMHFLPLKMNPGAPLGISITNTRCGHESVNTFVEWLNKVFN